MGATIVALLAAGAGGSAESVTARAQSAWGLTARELCALLEHESVDIDSIASSAIADTLSASCARLVSARRAPRGGELREAESDVQRLEQLATAAGFLGDVTTLASEAEEVTHARTMRTTTAKMRRPKHICIADAEVSASTAKHPAELPNASRRRLDAREGYAWYDFPGGLTEVEGHWSGASWLVLNATSASRGDYVGSSINVGASEPSAAAATTARALPSCSASLRPPLHPGLAADMAAMWVGNVGGVFVDYHGQLLAGMGTMNQALYHDFLAQLRVDGRDMGPVRWSGRLRRVLAGESLQPSSPQAKWPFLRWKPVLALAERLKRPVASACAATNGGCPRSLVPIVVLTRPTLVLLDRHFRNFYHFLTLGLARLVAALPLLQGENAHVLAHSDAGGGAAAGFRHLRGALALLGLRDALQEYDPCRLHFLHAAVMATPLEEAGTAPQRLLLTSQADATRANATLTVIDRLSPQAALAIRRVVLPAAHAGNIAESKSSSLRLLDGAATGLQVLVVDRRHSVRRFQDFASVLKTVKVAARRASASSHEVKPLHCEQMTLEEQVISFASAKLAIAVEGACLANALWMRPGAAIIEVGLGESPPHEVLPKAACGTTHCSTCGRASTADP
eukprot:TRINITY_DN11190_c0_g1_i1.p1 TRINITY_DN11190_c0_g1~~TRINITY_DN11190_c0_g1_i1.p1  ORF type:complete len:626 (-),score=113.23 TRINITY_DN11190_c0_g1_i1:257-2134(-)